MSRWVRQALRGQVLVETALAAVGIVVIAFMIVRVGVWLNDSLVLRNRAFQNTRVAAASSSPGMPYGVPTPIHLIGPGPESTGGVPPQGLLGSAVPPGCTGAGATWLTQATEKRWDVLTKQSDAAILQEEAEVLSDRARDLIVASPESYPWRRAATECSGNTCKSANWFWVKAEELETKLREIADTEALIASLQSQLAAAQDALAACEAGGGGKGGGGGGKGDPSPDCSAEQAQVDSLQSQLADANTRLADLIVQRDAICPAISTGNPWVGGAPACTPAAIRAYAAAVNNRAVTWADEVKTKSTRLQNLGQDIQTLVLDAEDLERRGRAACASGHD